MSDATAASLKEGFEAVGLLILYTDLVTTYPAAAVALQAECREILNTRLHTHLVII